MTLKEYEVTAAGMAVLDQSQPGDWDMMVIDAVAVHRGRGRETGRTACRQAADRRLATLTVGKYDGKVGICDNCLPVLGLVALGQGINTADITAETLPKPQEPLMALRKAAKQVSDVASPKTALATGDVDIIVGGGGWLTAVLAKDNPNLDRTILKQGGLRWAQSIGAVDWRGGWHDQARPGTGVPAIYRFPRRSGASLRSPPAIEACPPTRKPAIC